MRHVTAIQKYKPPKVIFVIQVKPTHIFVFVLYLQLNVIVRQTKSDSKISYTAYHNILCAHFYCSSGKSTPVVRIYTNMLTHASMHDTDTALQTRFYRY